MISKWDSSKRTHTHNDILSTYGLLNFVWQHDFSTMQKQTNKQLLAKKKLLQKSWNSWKDSIFHAHTPKLFKDHLISKLNRTFQI